MAQNTVTKSNKMTTEQLRLRDAEPVRGKFSFTEVPGGTLEFSYRKYKGPATNYSLEDGKVYTIPRGVAKHLATTGKYPVHEYATDESGKPMVRVGRMKQRYNFESLEFFDDIGGQESSLYTVEKV